MTKRDELDPVTLQPANIDDAAHADVNPLQREAYEWIARFMAGSMTSADLDAMKSWYGQSRAHAAAYAEARRMWNALGLVAHAPMDETEGVRRASRDAERFPGRIVAPMGRRAVIGGALAATAIYALVKPPMDLWPSISELRADYRTGVGEQRQVTLADHLSLHLNTRTSIAIRSQTAEMTQVELIAGEAAFSTGGSTGELTVIAGAGRIHATDSEFNLRCDGSDVSIACLSGSLAIARDGHTVQLVARQQAGYGDRGIGSISAVNADHVTAWLQGRLVFEGTPVSQVIAEINRYRMGRILLMNEKIGRRLLTAQLLSTETDKIVIQIVHIFGAKARALPGGVIVLT
ncbi:hypothetical protein CCR94_15900 [Rhodoblastus sphagnicola]|uniref:Iron dicitrate transport regulator FecR n=1 Tax=Rhodoblastus sphagnicola TaxID=333368 RepID=A0A2S6N3V2_9HYPH|nr:FecR domain-containing protein [Rhodoblastus sphagnicola]MBB4198901.1 transmembrane sensor [Rhodoblastus sphagnicola]PPQ29286.1 hypothetical protein CCR94_15900 [Rhodoblastus sphagnicola]